MNPYLLESQGRVIGVGRWVIEFVRLMNVGLVWLAVLSVVGCAKAIPVGDLAGDTRPRPVSDWVAVDGYSDAPPDALIACFRASIEATEQKIISGLARGSSASSLQTLGLEVLNQTAPIETCLATKGYRPRTANDRVTEDGQRVAPWETHDQCRLAAQRAAMDQALAVLGSKPRQSTDVRSTSECMTSKGYRPRKAGDTAGVK